jgi:anti-sigma-K factor RskA
VRRNWWRTAFLSVTAVAILMELWASFDRNPETDPWTDLIVAYIPMEITALAIGGLALWLVVHFGLRYWRKGPRESR